MGKFRVEIDKTLVKDSEHVLNYVQYLTEYTHERVRLLKRVLFVCVENARRSQMAEALLNKLAEGQAVAASAGDRAASRVDPKAIEVMKEIGIDITKQRPKPLTLKMVEEADAVITMGCGADVCPVIPKRVEEWKIEDPAGKPIAKFREVRNEIQKRVEKLIKRLEEADR